MKKLSFDELQDVNGGEISQQCGLATLGEAITGATDMAKTAWTLGPFTIVVGGIGGSITGGYFGCCVKLK